MYGEILLGAMLCEHVREHFVKWLVCCLWHFKV